ncbi:MAG TPA: hypothetical protein GX507_08290 [Clostridia bacterium]|nr:hypothetical protein [Clostridia bacterium]
MLFALPGVTLAGSWSGWDFRLSNGTVTIPVGSSGVSSTEQTPTGQSVFSTGQSVFRIRFSVSGRLPVGTEKVFIGEDGRKTWIIRIPIGSPQNPPGLSPETPGSSWSGNQPGNAQGGFAEQRSQKNAFLTEKEQEMLDLINAERERAGLHPLIADEVLTRLARMKSEDMIEKGYFSHDSPTYGSPFDMMRKAGVKYTTAGENLAGAPTVERAHTGLMNSEGHRRNILNPSFKRIGIGIIEGGPYGLMVTQMFTG